jgi:hypothetical protein
MPVLGSDEMLECRLIHRKKVLGNSSEKALALLRVHGDLIAVLHGHQRDNVFAAFGED